MFSVLFEVHPAPDQWDAYLNTAGSLRPELEQVDGFIDNIRYRSLTRDGWLLSLSNWRDEKSLVRWRTRMRHHQAQESGRDRILLDYHLRVGQITADTGLPPGQVTAEQRLDETEAGAATTVTLIDARLPSDRVSDAASAAAALGLPAAVPGLVAWDVFDAVLTPGDAILMLSWTDGKAASQFVPPAGTRLRQVRIIRDYGMFDRREAPQYYPDAKGRETLHG